jgi:hypothetical protein
MAGIDRLAETMGRDSDLDLIERDNLCGDAADAIERLTRERDEAIRQGLVIGAEAAKQAAENKRLRETLQFYADADSYLSTRSSPIVSTGTHRASPVEQDFGRKAFHALSVIETEGQDP